MSIRLSEVLAPCDAPCKFCPYRKDVPSGVWAEGEYDALPPYDAEFPVQPQKAFLCHEQTGHLCAGWVGTHGADNLLALPFLTINRLISPDEYRKTFEHQPHPNVPLWESGTAAAEHGKREIKTPTREAAVVVGKLLTKPAPIKPRMYG